MNVQKRQAYGGTEHLGVVLLAAGYGTRLQRDVSNAPHLAHLTGVPKPLLPIAGCTILSHWISALSAIPAQAATVVVTNASHAPLYESWASEARAQGANIIVVSDGSMSNSSRLGAVKDISIGIDVLRRETVADKALIIAGDTLLPGLDLSRFVSEFSRCGQAAATFAYPLSDMSDCVRRGMFRVRREGTDVLLAEELVEKPQTPTEAPSNLASAPVYMLKRSVWHTVDDFLKESQVKGGSLEKRDAPGFWLGWLVKQLPCRLFQIEKRIDIGGLNHYMDALWDISFPSASNVLPGAKEKRALDEPAVGRAYPRVGLLGNPSDGYSGKVISISIASEGFAEVVATPNEMFVVHHNQCHELNTEFGDLCIFLDHVQSHGFDYSAKKLVLAAVVVFAREYKRYLEREKNQERGKSAGLEGLPVCQLVYSSSIPPCIGLSGSSAFILATFRALARFYGTTLENVNGDIRAWPLLMQSAEADLLGIACGLQDRVIQVMQGCVAMDFTKSAGAIKGGRWDWLPESALPELWVAYYNEKGLVGESSGRVHGDLKSRFQAGDPHVLENVKKLCAVADTGRNILEQSAKGASSALKQFAALLNKNFELRTSLVGAAVVGKQNLKLVSVAKDAGFAAKMTGSGGCALCVPDPVRVLSKGEIQAATSTFKTHGIALHRVKVLPRRVWSA